MAKTRDDKIYERGVKDGKEGSLLDDFANSMGRAWGGRQGEIYDKGYDYGREHRGESSDGQSAREHSESTSHKNTRTTEPSGAAHDSSGSSLELPSGIGYIVFSLIGGYFASQLIENSAELSLGWWIGGLIGIVCLPGLLIFAVGFIAIYFAITLILGISHLLFGWPAS